MVTGVLASILALAAAPGPAAQAAPSPSATPAGQPTTVCTISQVHEVSGLVATVHGYVVINDGNWDATQTRIFYLDRSCRVERSVGYPTAARDPEDVAVAPDGTLWIADVGDNFNAPTRRSTIALWKLSDKAKRPVIHRFTYPDGPHDAEALLLDGDGQPLIVTKELGGQAGVYTPAEPARPAPADPVPLTRVGTVKLPSSDTPNPWGSVGRRTITGAAASPDRRYVTLRTYADAYEWQVVDGDVLAAITRSEPVATPLPDEPQGEAVAYTRDGSGYLTAGDQPGTTALLRYPVPPRPTEPVEQEPNAAASGGRNAEPAAMGVLGVSVLVLLVGVGILTWASRRRRSRRN